jgi:Ca2+-binding RTX toxin-like protein
VTVFYGTDRPDLLDARPYGLSKDYLDGKGTADQLHGGDGDDDLFGGPGSDYLYGEGGADTLDGASRDALGWLHCLNLIIWLKYP